ncbi:MAG: ribonuclease J [Rhodobiaceae bacterium]|nr:ribonuclease J [Rhodobiaceae bacterium]MCC0013077.1 ribonuclease J [Rhodobiaceae bacterium]MCC0019253.1 ribonuclease J [Rhodobiaceae bacterium]MCC0062274.1 ribonuclease J [Rhodobiaceae bacterium]
MTDELVFVPLGGLGEIGMNLGLYGYGPSHNRRWLMVDCGIGFADAASMPGIDVVMADTSFIEEERGSLEAIVLTHAHEDHFGALPDLWPRFKVPVYATAFTAALLEAKIAGESGTRKVPVKVVPLGGKVEAGPFSIEFITVAHSIPEPNALAITTKLGTVIHSGDWKIDPDPVIGGPIDEARLRAIGAEGCRALVCDSTNAMREGVSPSEAGVAETLKELIAKAPKRVAVTCFASNLARIRSVAEAAVAADRNVVVVGRAMHRVISVGRELGMLDGLPAFLDDSQYGYLPRDKVVLLCTGSQGEPRAAMTRIAAGKHPTIELSPGDQVIYSARQIPGNEKSVGTVLNGLIRDGIEVLDDRSGLVHVSGHPRRGELVQLFDWLKPQVMVPAHGEAMHMAANADLAREAGIPEVVSGFNGDMIRLVPGPAAKIDEVRSGRVVRDGQVILDADNEALKERRRLAFAGLVCVAFGMEENGDIGGDIEVELAGVPETGIDDADIADLVLDAVEETVLSMPPKRRRRVEDVRESVRRAVRRQVEIHWGKKPRVQVFIIEL